MSHTTTRLEAEIERLREQIKQLDADAARGRQAEQQLQFLEARRQSHLANTPLAVIVWDTNFRVVEWNTAAEQIFGYSAAEAAGKHGCELLVSAEVRPHVDLVFARLLQQTGGERSTNENIAKSGRRILCEWYNTPVLDQNGTVVGVASIAQDVSAQMATARALSHSEGMLRSILENAPDIVIQVDRTGRVLYINRVAENYSHDEVVGRPIYTFAVPEHQHLIRTAIDQAFATGKAAEYETKDATNGRWYQTRLAPVIENGDVASVVLLCLDIHDRKTQQEALQEQQKIFKVLAENVPGVVYLCANDDRYTMRFLNDAVFDLLGIPAGEFLEDRVSFVELYHPDDAAVISPVVDAAIQRRGRFHLVYRLKHADGHWIWVEEYGQGVFYEDGELRFLEGTIFDITAKREAEEALRRSKEELEQLVNLRTAELKEANLKLATDYQRQRELTRAAKESEVQLQSKSRMLRRMLDIHERDRQLIAYEIHDGLVQYVTGITMHLQAAESKLTRDPESARRDLAYSTKVLSETIDEARRLIDGLQPGVLEEQGVVPAVQYLCDQTEQLHGIKIHAQIDVSFRRLAPAIEMAIYRIVQEGLNNVVKHSQSKEASVTLKQRHDELVIKIVDEGIGFDPKKVKSHRYGLTGVADRARLLGGRARLKSEPGHGTRLRVKLPLKDVLMPEDWPQPTVDESDDGSSGDWRFA